MFSLLKRILSCLLCAALLSGGVFAMEPISPGLRDGLDVSAYQGDIDFEAVRQAGYTAVYIRAGEGDDYTDPEFLQNAERAEKAGVDYGFYYYVTARDTAAARAQAQRFAWLIRDLDYDARPAMDFEQFEGLDAEEIRAIGLEFLETLERLTDVTPMLYTDAYAARELWSAEFARYPLWIAEYNGGEAPEDSPVWQNWTGYQFADDGRVPGIEGNVDLDRYTGGILVTASEKGTSGQSRVERYTVRYGDTLGQIAKRFGVTVAEIAEENHIADPNLIYVGQVLYIKAAAPSGQSYTVRPGDTLWSIAQRFGTTVQAIVRENGIANPNLIYAGEVLLIP